MWRWGGGGSDGGNIPLDFLNNYASTGSTNIIQDFCSYMCISPNMLHLPPLYDSSVHGEGGGGGGGGGAGLSPLVTIPGGHWLGSSRCHRGGAWMHQSGSDLRPLPWSSAGRWLSARKLPSMI